METYIGPLTGSLIDNIIGEIKKKHNKEKIMKNIIDPLLGDLTTRYYPHFVTITAILIVIVVMLLALLIVVLLNRDSYRCPKQFGQLDILEANCI